MMDMAHWCDLDNVFHEQITGNRRWVCSRRKVSDSLFRKWRACQHSLQSQCLWGDFLSCFFQDATCYLIWTKLKALFISTLLRSYSAVSIVSTVYSFFYKVGCYNPYTAEQVDWWGQRDTRAKAKLRARKKPLVVTPLFMLFKPVRLANGFCWLGASSQVTSDMRTGSPCGFCGRVVLSRLGCS